MSRLEVVAAAAVRVLATAGARGLTHRAVDAEAGLPAGSTSNVVRSRRALVDAVVTELLARDRARLARLAEQGHRPPGDLLAAFVADTLAGARDDVLARAALLVDPDAAALREARISLTAVGTDTGVPAHAARLVVAAVDGVLQAGALHGVQPDSRVLAAMVDAALDPPAAGAR